MIGRRLKSILGSVSVTIRGAAMSASSIPGVETGDDVSSFEIETQDAPETSTKTMNFNQSTAHEQAARQPKIESRKDKLSDADCSICPASSNLPRPVTPSSPLASPPSEMISFSDTTDSDSNDVRQQLGRPRPLSGLTQGHLPLRVQNTADGDGHAMLPFIKYSSKVRQWKQPTKTTTATVTDLRIITWNIDFMAPHPAERVQCILQHLKDITKFDTDSKPGAPISPTCILLQELCQASFDGVLADAWVRRHFVISPPDTSCWYGKGLRKYGIATLVSRNVPVEAAQMLYFHDSRMGRTALFVDVLMSMPENDRRAVRIANTHLESLPSGEPARPRQLRAIAVMLTDRTATGGGIVCGDMNMIRPADRDIHEKAGLDDACADPRSFTWGFQPPTKFPPGRLDRVFHVRSPDLSVDPVKLIGEGLRTNNGDWASDHYGLTTEIRLLPRPA